jgi:hypothetical protein
MRVSWVLLLASFLSSAPRTDAASPNIVLISIDTLRADHLPMYGYSGATTPFLATMAEKGIVFDRVTTPIPSTTPSHGSMLTGQYPSRHGSVALSVPIRLGTQTIAEALQGKGYYTAGAVAVSHIGRAGHFDQGFADFSGPDGAQRNGDAVNADLFRFIARWRNSSTRRQPFFLFAHYFDCHAPYGWWRGVQTDPATLSLPDRNARYDESIRHVDDVIAALYRHLATLGLMENTIFFVTADHGEQIGDRGLPYGHADIYTETVAVPLIVFGRSVPSTRVHEAVSLLDVAPAIAAAAGVKLRGPIDGKNILPPLDDTLATVLYKLRGLPDADRELLVVGNPWYTRSIALHHGSYVFIRNLDHVYRNFRQARVSVGSDTDRRRSKALSVLKEAGGERHYAIPVTSFEPFMVTLDVVPEGMCDGPLKVLIPPGIGYFNADLDKTAPTRLQFAGARQDTFSLTLPATCKASLFFRLDREADAPPIAAASHSTRLFSVLLAARKSQEIDELYDLEHDPGMRNNLIAAPAYKRLTEQLDQRGRDLFRLIYGLGSSRNDVSTLPPEEIEKLKSLGYLF